MKRLKSIACLLLLSCNILAQDLLDCSEFIKKSRSYYFDSLGYWFKNNSKSKVLVFKEEMPEDYKCASDSFKLITESKSTFLEENNSKFNLISQVDVVSINNEGQIIISVHLLRVYSKRKNIFTKKKIYIYGPLINNPNMSADDYETSSYYRYYRYVFNCENKQWELIQASFRNPLFIRPCEW